MPKNTGVLVLAGLLDPCGDIGTQGRFALLPIPWTATEFALQVSTLIRFELSEKQHITDQAIGFPEETSDAEALARGIGLRAWFRTVENSLNLNDLLLHGWSEGRVKLAANEIDELSFHGPSIDFQWPDSAPDDAATISQFELTLLAQIRSS